MKTLNLKRIFGALFCLFLANQIVLACTCRSGSSVYTAFENSTAVFTGKVLDFKDVESEEIETVDGVEEKVRFTERIYRFEIIEKFKGIKNKIVEVSVGDLGAGCHENFDVGESYLVYAGNENGKIVADSKCSRTENLESAADQIFFIREYLKGKKEPQIYGSVYRTDSARDRLDSITTKAENIKVLLEGKKTFEAFTDKEGLFRFNNIPDGDYVLKLPLEPKFEAFIEENFRVRIGKGKVGYDDRGMDFLFSIFDEAAFLELRFGWVNSVAGKVFDANGVPVKMSSVRLLPYNLPFINIKGDQIFDVDEKGEFYCSGETPGKYLLAAEIYVPFGKNDRVRIFYPQSETPDKATPINLKPNDELKLDIILPARFVTREIKGQIVWADGQPAVSASFSLRKTDDLENKAVKEMLDRGFDWGGADEQGNFVLQAFEGGEYWLHAWDYVEDKRDEEAPSLLVQAKPVRLKVGKSNEPLKLILPKP